MEEKKNAYKIVVGKPEGKKTLRRRRRRQKCIRMYLRETGWKGVD
jgi:hypothetical protein